MDSSLSMWYILKVENLPFTTFIGRRMQADLARGLRALLVIFMVHCVATAQSPGVSGEAVYKERCAYCHGAEGRGDGAPGAHLTVKPRDLTSGVYKIRSTESGSLPTDADIMRSISAGLPGSSMPAFKGVIPDDEIAAVITHIKTFSPRFGTERAKPVPVPRRVSSTESGRARGKTLYSTLECGACHGSDGAGTDAIATEFEDEWGNPIKPTNLTEPWTFRGGRTEKDVYMRLRTGLDGTPMPSYGGVVSDGELYNVAQYVASLARKPAWDMTAEELTAHYEGLSAKSKNDPVAWGKYLVSYMGCGDCHTPVRADGTMMEEYTLAGGQRWEMLPYYNSVYPANLTSDTETGIGSYSDDQLRQAITRGVRLKDGSRMLPFPMPWPNYAGLKDEDIDALIAYLRTVPPVRNAVPARDEPNIVSYLWYKFQALILKKPFPAYIYPGNAGEPEEASMSYSGLSRKEARP